MASPKTGQESKERWWHGRGEAPRGDRAEGTDPTWSRLVFMWCVLSGTSVSALFLFLSMQSQFCKRWDDEWNKGFCLVHRHSMAEEERQSSEQMGGASIAAHLRGTHQIQGHCLPSLPTWRKSHLTQRRMHSLWKILVSTRSSIIPAHCMHISLTLWMKLALPKLWLRVLFLSQQGNHFTDFLFSSFLSPYRSSCSSSDVFVLCPLFQRCMIWCYKYKKEREGDTELRCCAQPGPSALPTGSVNPR